MQSLFIVSRPDDYAEDRRNLTFSLSLSAFVLGAAFGPSDCWIRSSFFFCKETTYCFRDAISAMNRVGCEGYGLLPHSRLLYSEWQQQAVSVQFGVLYQELAPRPWGSTAAP